MNLDYLDHSSNRIHVSYTLQENNSWFVSILYAGFTAELTGTGRAVGTPWIFTVREPSRSHGGTFPGSKLVPSLESLLVNEWPAPERATIRVPVLRTQCRGMRIGDQMYTDDYARAKCVNCTCPFYEHAGNVCCFEPTLFRPEFMYEARLETNIRRRLFEMGR